LTGARTMPIGGRMRETQSERVTAFQRLADQRLDASYRLANAILGDESQSQDAVHDAVVVAWQQWSSLRDRAKFDAWFDRIVVNVSRDRLRQASRRLTMDIADIELGTPDMTTEVHRRLLVEQALGQLKPDDIVVLALRYFLDLQLADIAVLLDVPVQTVNTRLRAAKTRLRNRLEQQSADQVPR
jgi:RNA polymerase sigma factor (sigma-70 family)